MLEEIREDVYFIIERLREIDSGYRIFFNKKTAKFELHCNNQYKTSLCLVLPFEQLDVRTIDYVQKTRIENMNKLMKEMDEQNELAKKQKMKEIKNTVMEAFG